METATARAPQPGNEEGRPVAGRPSDYFDNCNSDDDSVFIGEAQRSVIVPRILATHWFRFDVVEGAQHG